MLKIKRGGGNGKNSAMFDFFRSIINVYDRNEYRSTWGII